MALIIELRSEDGGSNEEATEKYADALPEKHERTEDQFKEAAEELGDVPQ